MLTVTERIRRIFGRKGIEYSASQVVEDLAKKGVDVTIQLVYNVRSDLRKASEPQSSSNEPNQKTLQQTIEDVINKSNKPLSVSEIAGEVKKTYSTKSHNFSHMVRIECYRLHKKHKVVPVYEGRSVKYTGTETWIKNLDVTPEPIATKPLLLALPTELSARPSPSILENLRKLQNVVEMMGGLDSLQKHLETLKKLKEIPNSEKVIEILTGVQNV